MKKILILFVFAVLITACTQNTKTENATDSKANDSAVFRPTNIHEQVQYNRAVEATIWGMPAVSMAAIRASLKRDLTQISVTSFTALKCSNQGTKHLLPIIKHLT